MARTLVHGQFERQNQHTPVTVAPAPWARSSNFQFLAPKVPRPYDILEDSSKSHRDRSKKYICPYLLTEPRSCKFENRQKSSKIVEITIFGGCVQFRIQLRKTSRRPALTLAAFAMFFHNFTGSIFQIHSKMNLEIPRGCRNNRADFF